MSLGAVNCQPRVPAQANRFPRPFKLYIYIYRDVVVGSLHHQLMQSAATPLNQLVEIQTS